MITLKLPILLNQEDAAFISEMQRIQSSMIRTAYKLAEKSVPEKEMRVVLNERFGSSLDSWYKQSAVYSGRGMFKADSKTGRTNRIFGGKLNFIKRTKNKITSNEWKAHRLLPLYVVGESPPKGNRKFDFNESSIIFKPHKGKKIEIFLPKMRKNYKKKWESAVIEARNKNIPITVSLTPTQICLSFEEADLMKFKKPIPNRCAGIDMNPNYIGISVFDSDKCISTKLFDLKELTGKCKSESKIRHETRQIANSIGLHLKHLQVTDVFVESLNFKQGNSGKGKNFNRLTKNQWKRNDFLTGISKFYSLKEINAAYSSTIGNINNPHLPDPVAASAEIARRGYECYTKKSKKFYPELIAQKYIEDRWKKTDMLVISNWKELHDFLKNSKLKYRVPIPDRNVFRIFQSKKSQVYILDDFCYT